VAGISHATLGQREDRLLVTVLTGHLSLAMQHVRQFESARETSLTLQRAMLPLVEPPPGFVVRYEPAVPPLEIGGTGMTYCRSAKNRIGIVVGDCVGRGLPAAAVMGQLRSSARALLINGANRRDYSNNSTRRRRSSQMRTAQPCSWRSWIPNPVSCGTAMRPHAPVLVGAGAGSGSTVFTDARSVPLAVCRDERRPQASQVLPPGSTLMVYTDGLVERKHEPIDDGITRAADVLVQTMNLPLDAVADTMLRDLLRRRATTTMSRW